MKDDIHIEVQDLDMSYGDYLVIRNLSFKVKRGSVFVIMGGSGCGKSTLLKHMIGLMEPQKGTIFYNGENFSNADPSTKGEMLKRFGILYQAGALWSTMTISENIELVLEQHTSLKPKERREIASYKLSLVGLKGIEDYYPFEISGGMRKRAGLARAMALDPEILFFDEPSSGLDPINSKNLDDLILELKDSLGTTIVVVSHELPSIFAIADDSIFLDAQTKTMTAQGNPNDLLHHSKDSTLIKFLSRDKIA